MLAAASVAAGALFLVAYPSIGPSTSYTPEELEWLRENAQQQGDTSGDPFAGNEASTESHWRNLRDGVRVVIHHPQGYGLGNAGVVAKRTGVEIRAGESTYTELGVDAGVAGVARVRALEPRRARADSGGARRGSPPHSRPCS